MSSRAETPPSDASFRRDIHIHTDSSSIGKQAYYILDYDPNFLSQDIMIYGSNFTKKLESSKTDYRLLLNCSFILRSPPIH